MKTRIKELRLSKGISQTALAVNVGCSQNTISRIELEETSPSSELLVEFSNYFNVSIDYILYKSDIKNFTPQVSLMSLPPRLSEYVKKMLLLSEIDKKTIYVLIDHLSNN